ncbi:hypothetical protein ACE6H2_021316 [Prunus campanulata]
MILKTYPENFELEFSETRQRSGAQGEAGRSASSTYPTNMKSPSMKVAESSKAIPCSLSGSSNIRRLQVTTVCSGTIDAREQSAFCSEDCQNEVNSTQWAPSTLSDIFASQSQHFQDNLHGHPSIMKSTGHNCIHGMRTKEKRDL